MSVDADNELRELVTAVVATGDPTLLQRACFALDLILAEQDLAASD